MFQYAPCVILIQFSALHSRGSSHGQSRITRRAYNKPYYVPMMNDAYSLWRDLERESGTTLYRSGHSFFIMHVYVRTVVSSCGSNYRRSTHLPLPSRIYLCLLVTPHHVSYKLCTSIDNRAERDWKRRMLAHANR